MPGNSFFKIINLRKIALFRCYISFDILRRILQNYFNYDIVYCMNITDIDDKVWLFIVLDNSNMDIINSYFHQIIVKARQEYLYDEYVKAGKATYQELVEDLKSALLLIKGKFDNELDKDKKEMYKKLVNRIEAKINSESQDDINKTIVEFQDILSIWLDKEKGKTVNKNEIFFDLPKRFETSYHDDMAALNVKYLLK